MIEVGSLVCFVCITFDIKMHTLASLAITHWNAQLVARGSSPKLLWVINMIRSVVVQTFAWKCTAMPCLPSSAVKTGFCRHTWSADHLNRRPTKHWWPRDQYMVDDHFSMPVVFPLGRWPSTVIRECSLGLVQFLEEQSKVNRGSLCIVTDFRANPSTHALDPLPEAALLLS